MYNPDSRNSEWTVSCINIFTAWFGVKERFLATSIGFVFNSLGIGVAYVVTPAIVHSNNVAT